MKTLRYRCVDCDTMMATQRKRCPSCHDKHVHERKCRICGETFTRKHKEKLCESCRHKSHQVALKVDNSKVIGTVKRNPCATMQQVGDKYGISRERVRQIMLKASITKIDKRLRSEYHICLNCGNKIKSSHNTKYCNERCEYEYTHPMVECYNCHVLFRKPLNELTYWGEHNQGNGKIKDHIFCSHKCSGSYIGKHYGLSVHPENCKFVRKYDHNKIKTLLNDGLSIRQIAKQTNTPYHRVWTISHRMKQGVLVG